MVEILLKFSNNWNFNNFVEIVFFIVILLQINLSTEWKFLADLLNLFGG